MPQVIPSRGAHTKPLSDLRLPHKVRDAREAAISRCVPRSAIGPIKRVEQVPETIVLLDQVLLHQPFGGLVDVGLHLADGVASATVDCVLVESKDLDAANMSILAVLVVLLDVQLHDPATQRVPVPATATVGDGNVLPADRIGKRDLGELEQIVMAGSGVERDVGRGVRLILVVVDVEPNSADLDAA